MPHLSPSETEAVLAQVGITPETWPGLWRVLAIVGSYRARAVATFIGPCIGADGDERYVGALRRYLFQFCNAVVTIPYSPSEWRASLISNEIGWQSNAEGLTEAHALVLAAKKSGVLE